jgi:glycosyltransferase involved in cell wall biosynthesis
VDHGVLDDHKLADLYRNATVGLVLSTTNYSLIPHEMMACGLPVVELDSASTRAEFPVGTVALAPPTPDGIAAQIVRLLTDPVSRGWQAQRAVDYVGEISWQRSARQVEAALVKGVLA